MKWKSIAFVAALVAVGLPALAALADWCASRPPMERPGGRGCTERSGPLASVAEGEARAMRFLKDLDIFVAWRGADFMYSRGIAETLREAEDIWELAYQFKKAMLCEA